ncbi:MAG TPA: hypothetical protein VJ762_15895 [Sphingobium sp.]|nr:hypothetical protein [Sphingobium sp.]
MVIAAIILAIFSAALASAIVSKRRYNAAVGVLGGLAAGITCWAIASFGMFIWFVNG